MCHRRSTPCVYLCVLREFSYITHSSKQKVMIKKVCVCECIVMNEWMDESFDNSLTDCKRPKTKQNLKISIFHSLLWCRWHSDIISIVVIFFQIFSFWIFLSFMCQWMVVVPASIENELCARKIGIKLLSMFRAKKRQRRQCSKQKQKKCMVCSTYSM